MATVDGHVNCRTRVMEVLFGTTKVKLNIFHAYYQPSMLDESSCFIVDVVNKMGELERRSEMDKVNEGLADRRLNHSHLYHSENITRKVKDRF